MAEFEQDVNILSILEKVLKAYDMVLMERSVNFDLGHQLLLGSSFCQGALLNNFSSGNSLILQVGKLEATSETTLTKEFSL